MGRAWENVISGPRTLNFYSAELGDSKNTQYYFFGDTDAVGLEVTLREPPPKWQAKSKVSIFHSSRKEAVLV